MKHSQYYDAIVKECDSRVAVKLRILQRPLSLDVVGPFRSCHLKQLFWCQMRFQNVQQFAEKEHKLLCTDLEIQIGVCNTELRGEETDHKRLMDATRMKTETQTHRRISASSLSEFMMANRFVRFSGV